MSNGPIEPSADMRELAHNLRQTYVALELEGFSERQAIGIIGAIIAAGMQNGEESS